jgi:hypothetical protein
LFTGGGLQAPGGCWSKECANELKLEIEGVKKYFNGDYSLARKKEK